jgi:DNA-binding LacI/PurR family transcriptional regulator
LSARMTGFLQALAAGPKPIEPVVLHGANTCAGGIELTKTLLKSHPGVTAIFAANDIMAFGVMRELMRSGRSVPDDVSVIGFDDVELASVVHPTLTTIHQPTYEIGKSAVDILLRLTSRANSAPEQRLFGVSLIERESCRKLK